VGVYEHHNDMQWLIFVRFARPLQTPSVAYHSWAAAAYILRLPGRSRVLIPRRKAGCLDAPTSAVLKPVQQSRHHELLAASKTALLHFRISAIAQQRAEHRLDSVEHSKDQIRMATSMACALFVDAATHQVVRAGWLPSHRLFPQQLPACTTANQQSAMKQVGMAETQRGAREPRFGGCRCGFSLLLGLVLIHAVMLLHQAGLDDGFNFSA
jgi:hypothetical protein